jgi:hypothetical protein
MTTPDEVKMFLSDFKTKLEFLGVVFLDDRAKNTKTLSNLEITTIQRKKALFELNLGRANRRQTILWKRPLGIW